MRPEKYCGFLAFLALLSGCANDSTSDLIDAIPVGVVTYNQNIKSVIANNCLNCHGAVPENGASISLTNYNEVRDAVMNEDLIGKISKENGQNGLMPDGGPRMPQSTIELFSRWQTDGFQE